MSQTLLYLEGNCGVGVELRPEATSVLAVPLQSGDKLLLNLISETTRGSQQGALPGWGGRPILIFSVFPF